MGKRKKRSHVLQPCKTVRETPAPRGVPGLVEGKREEAVRPGEGRCPGGGSKGKGVIKVGQGGAFQGGEWREIRDEQGWLQVSWLPSSVLLWPSPAPDGHSLSCPLLKQCVGLVGGVCLLGTGTQPPRQLHVGGIPALCGAPDLAILNLSCFCIMPTGRTEVINA